MDLELFIRIEPERIPQMPDDLPNTRSDSESEDESEAEEAQAEEAQAEETQAEPGQAQPQPCITSVSGRDGLKRIRQNFVIIDRAFLARGKAEQTRLEVASNLMNRFFCPLIVPVTWEVITCDILLPDYDQININCQ